MTRGVVTQNIAEPSGWSKLPLGEVGRWLSGGTPSLSVADYWGGDVPWVSPKDMKAPRLHDAIDRISDSAVAAGATVLPAGAVLMVVRGMILAHSMPVARAERPLSFNQDIKAVVCRDRVDSEFLLYWLLSNAHRLLSLTTESTHGTKRLPTETLFREVVACPPVEEQRAIATVLSDVDDLLAKLDQLIAKKRGLKQASMQQLLTGRTRLAGFSAPWPESSFGELFEFLRNASNSRAELSASGDVGYVHYGDIHLHSSPYFNGSRDLLTFIDAAKVKSTPLLRDGDVLMADASEDTEAIGKAVEITGLGVLRAVGGLHTLVLRPRPGRLARGFAGYVQFMPAVRAALVRAATGVSVYGVSKSSVRAIVTPLPGVEEQSAIAEILSDMGAEIVALEARREKTRQLKQGMMQALLTGRIRLV